MDKKIIYISFSLLSFLEFYYLNLENEKEEKIIEAKMVKIMKQDSFKESMEKVANLKHDSSSKIITKETGKMIPAFASEKHEWNFEGDNHLSEKTMKV